MDRSPVQKTKLLFITERIDAQDDDLAFSLQWIEEFERQGFVVSVICLKSGTYPSTFRVHSLGKEKGYSKIRQLCIFYKLIFTVPHDRVFVHLSPYFLALGSPYWFLTRKPVYLWYTHYAMSMSLRISVFLAKRMFAATPQSLPQYEGNPKKTIVNHGVNSDFWKAAESTLEDEGNPHNLVSIHRLSRSKRLELVIRALALLPAKYTLTVYGRALDPVYFEELQALVKVLKLEKRVTFKGPVPMPELRSVYPHYRLMVNMASETIDKTMLEGMLYGIFPVTTQGNIKAIGLARSPENDTPEAIAVFIEKGEWREYTRKELRQYVVDHHGLVSLISKMSAYIREGK